MSDQPSKGNEDKPAGYEPPQYVPPAPFTAPEQGAPEQGAPEQGAPGQGAPVPPPPFEQPTLQFEQGANATQPLPPYGQSAPEQTAYTPGDYSQQPPSPYGQPPSPYQQQAFGQQPYAQPAPYGQQPYGQPNPYGQPAYYAMQSEPKGLSIASMVCGIASLFLGWIMLPQIAAVVLGHLALKREPSGKGMSITGLVLGYLCLLGYGLFYVFIAVMTATYGSYNY